MLKKWFIGLLVVGALALSVFTVAFAQDDTPPIPVDTDDFGRILMFRDGRINAFDMAAPVAIYYTEETLITETGNRVTVPNGIELLAIEPQTNEGHLALNAGLDELGQLIAGEVDSIRDNGFILRYRFGNFWVTAPADEEGKVYNFVWPNQVIPAG
jgi:hypothetical protein